MKLSNLAPAWFASLGLVACGGAAPGLNTSQRVSPRYLFPLGDGYSWTYDVETGAGPGTTLVTRVVSGSGDSWDVSDGTDTERYEVRPEGIFRTYGQTWLLRRPIQVGENWSSPLGGLATVVDMHASVDTGEGPLTECVKVRETGPDREVTSTYCAGVGLALRESDERTPSVRHVSQRLRSHSVASASPPM